MTEVTNIPSFLKMFFAPEKNSFVKNLFELSARYCHMEGYEPLDAPAPPPQEEKVKSKKKSKKAKGAEETQIEEKNEEKEGEKGMLHLLSITLA